MIGKQLAHYQITDLLGKGGMGEVYRAVDGKLGREVAIKILPKEFSGDPERAARFEREARTLASLQHPNVASIYGFEEVAGTRFLVMELVEGEDLAQRLESGPLPWKEAVDIARQVAEGLESAHVQDIVHRDLKPANIKITPTRDVKILDFGLARAYAGDTDSEATAIGNSPTITAAMTMQGTILGTAAYMSPEQARGRGVDKQSDIWSFGVLLYEMLTGDCLFKGETVSDSIGAILHRDPDLDRLPDVPPQIRTLLRRSLQRDKRKRLRDIGDARIELEEARSGQVTHQSKESGGRGKAGWIAAAAMALLAVVFGTMFFTRADEPGPAHTTLGLQSEEAVRLARGLSWAGLQVSADGTYVVFVGGNPSSLYLRNLDSFESTKLADTEGAQLPVFSPDGRWIAYFSRSSLWKIAVSGGAPVKISDTSRGPGLAWGDGELFFPRTNGGGLWAVSADGGELRQVSTLDAARDETSHRWPQVLPGGRHLLFTIKTSHIATFDDAAIGLLALDSGEVEVLLQGGSNPRYVPSGHLVYGRNSQLFAVPFDLESLSLEGTPAPVLDGVHLSDITGSTHFTLNSSGDLAYVPTVPDFWDYELLWIYRSGKVSALEVDQPRAFEVTISPRGDKLAAAVPAANDKVWIYDLQQNTTSRLTKTPGNDRRPIWSPDGRSIVYQNDRSGALDLYLISTDGDQAAEAILASEYDDLPTSWSPDGSRLLFTRLKPDGDADIWTMNMDGEREIAPFLSTPHREGSSQFSPDGKWVAYVSDSSGELEVYIRPYPGPGNPIRISRAGGRRPFWSREDNTLYFTIDHHIMALPVDAGTVNRPAVPQEVLTMGESIAPNLSLAHFGERFLATRINLEAKQHQIRVIHDWADRLGETAAGK